MITEDFCSFEVAKLLKEKGFDGDGGDCECHMFYSSYSKMIMPITEIGLVSDFDEVYYAPTHQMAMKWLREVHNLSVEVYRTACGYVGCIVSIPSGTDIKFLEEDGDDLPSGQYTTWEKACEAALKYCLENLIVI